VCASVCVLSFCGDVQLSTVNSCVLRTPSRDPPLGGEDTKAATDTDTDTDRATPTPLARP